MNRVARYVSVGGRALLDSRGSWWRFAYAVQGLSNQGLDDVEIGVQFACSHDKILNARRAYGLFAEFRKQGGSLGREAGSMRRRLDKSNWEAAARHYARHHSIGDAFEDLYRNSELHARDFEETLKVKYGGDPLPQRLAILQKRMDEAYQDIWAAVEAGKLGTRIAEAYDTAHKAHVKQLDKVREALKEQKAGEA